MLKINRNFALVGDGIKLSCMRQPSTLLGKMI